MALQSFLGIYSSFV